MYSLQETYQTWSALLADEARAASLQAEPVFALSCRVRGYSLVLSPWAQILLERRTEIVPRLQSRSMTREILRLQARRFTSAGALAKEITALLECTDYSLLVEVSQQARGMLEAELQDRKTMGRVALEVVK